MVSPRFQRCAAGQQVELLECEADAGAAELRPGVVAQFFHGRVLKMQLPAAGDIQKPQDVQQRGFSAARTANDVGVVTLHRSTSGD